MYWLMSFFLGLTLSHSKHCKAAFRGNWVNYPQAHGSTSTCCQMEDICILLASSRGFGSHFPILNKWRILWLDSTNEIYDYQAFVKNIQGEYQYFSESDEITISCSILGTYFDQRCFTKFYHCTLACVIIHPKSEFSNTKRQILRNFSRAYRKIKPQFRNK